VQGGWVLVSVRKYGVKALLEQQVVLLFARAMSAVLFPTISRLYRLLLA
jgi:hypothetical protein